MGWLIGLPLHLFRFIVMGGLLILRLIVPIFIVAVVWFLVRRQRRKQGGAQKTSSPDFDGPVYTVDYKIVEEQDEEES